MTRIFLCNPVIRLICDSDQGASCSSLSFDHSKIYRKTFFGEDGFWHYKCIVLGQERSLYQPASLPSLDGLWKEVGDDDLDDYQQHLDARAAKPGDYESRPMDHRPQRE